MYAITVHTQFGNITHKHIFVGYANDGGFPTHDHPGPGCYVRWGSITENIWIVGPSLKDWKEAAYWFIGYLIVERGSRIISATVGERSNG